MGGDSSLISRCQRIEDVLVRLNKEAGARGGIIVRFVVTERPCPAPAAGKRKSLFGHFSSSLVEDGFPLTVYLNHGSKPIRPSWHFGYPTGRVAPGYFVLDKPIR